MSLLKIAEHIENFIKLPRHFVDTYRLQLPHILYSCNLMVLYSFVKGEEASPWLPRFTDLVPIHNRYIGGRQYYELRGGRKLNV